jgi:uridine kinase
MTAIVHALIKDNQTIFYYDVNQRELERAYNSIHRYLFDFKLLGDVIFNYKKLTLVNGSKIYFTRNGEQIRGFNTDLVIVDGAMPDCINGMFSIKNAKLIVNSASANKFKQIKNSLN